MFFPVRHQQFSEAVIDDFLFFLQHFPNHGNISFSIIYILCSAIPVNGAKGCRLALLRSPTGLWLHAGADAPAQRGHKVDQPPPAALYKFFLPFKRQRPTRLTSGAKSIHNPLSRAQRRESHNPYEPSTGLGKLLTGCPYASYRRRRHFLWRCRCSLPAMQSKAPGGGIGGCHPVSFGGIGSPAPHPPR